MQPNSARSCPYDSFPDSSKWRQSIVDTPPEDLDFIVGEVPRIWPKNKIATAGSCFAQNIARYLAGSGYNYFVPEDLPKIFPASVRSEYNYGVFSARYGNVYTTRQLLQLFERANGMRSNLGEIWTLGDGFADPYRPFIQPGGFASKEVLVRDRSQHLQLVQKMFRECHVFVFTLGLTEAWIANEDGSVLPVCPGCGAGEFDADTYSFVNFRYPEVRADLEQFLKLFREVNTQAKVVLTVSPVPLVATATGNHVATATTYSKSVLRAVAQDVAEDSVDVSYFPSYDMLAGPGVGVDAYASDRRNVMSSGVELAMRSFFRHYCGVEMDASEDGTLPQQSSDQGSVEADLDTVCDLEELVQ